MSAACSFSDHQVKLHGRNSASFRFYIQTCAAVVVEGATITPLYMEPPPCSRLAFSSIPLVLVFSAG
jgi:hypothetical protein